jgi:SP family arabinose:H+ symporter-like MFS transporter
MPRRKIKALLLLSVSVAALGGLLFGFDTAVIAGTTRDLTQTFHLSLARLGFTVSVALLGTVLGAACAGIPGQRLGSRTALRYMALLYLISAIGCAAAWNWEALIFWRFIGGLGIGGSSVLGPVYMAEIAPAKRRGRFVGIFQLCIVVGVLLAYLSNFLLDRMNLGVAEWRWDLGVASIPALVFFLLLFQVPQSSRWLVATGRLGEAGRVLGLLGSEDPEAEVLNILASLPSGSQETPEPLFQRKYRLPLFLAISLGVFNQFSGINAILYYLNDIFRDAGYSRASSELQAVAVGLLNLIATLLAMMMIDRLGRRTLLLAGSVGMVGGLSSIAAIMFGRLPQHLLLLSLGVYTFSFAFSQGAVIWVYISEVFPTLVRSKGQSLGASAHWISNALISGTFPLIAARSTGYPFVLFSAFMAVQFFVVLFIFPETKQLSLEQLQSRLEAKVSPAAPGFD